MQVLLVCTETQEAELGPLPHNFTVARELGALPACDVVMDLLFEENRQAHLPLLSGRSLPVIVSAPSLTGKGLPEHFIRINGWPGFLQGQRLEACGAAGAARDAATRVLELLGKTPEWLPDNCGMVAPRLVAGIINEAYLAWSEGIASQEAIDTAMKLGTNYPHGPFEWAGIIGTGRIVQLLQTLALDDERYQPCPALKNSVPG